MTGTGMALYMEIAFDVTKLHLRAINYCDIGVLTSCLLLGCCSINFSLESKEVALDSPAASNNKTKTDKNLFTHPR